MPCQGAKLCGLHIEPIKLYGQFRKSSEFGTGESVEHLDGKSRVAKAEMLPADEGVPRPVDSAERAVGRILS